MSQALETAFAMDAASIKFGFGVTAELGFEMKRLGVKKVMVLTDQSLLESTAVTTSLQSLRDEGIECVVYADVSVEPTDTSFADAVQFADQGEFDGYVAVGGGSVMDTAKAANLYDTHPAEFLEYVNAPIGKGTPVPGALKPLIAVPTTAGTGSETSGVAIFDMKEMHAKTGIANRALKPHMGLVDPENTRSMPRNVAAFSGFDVLCHGLESYTALPYTRREAPIDPAHRPAYQGSNPMSDVWASKAIEIVSAEHKTRRERPARRRGASEYVPRGDRCGRWIRYRRCSSAARDVLSGRRKRERFPTRRVSRRKADHSARAVGHFERASGIPIHGVSQPGPAPGSGEINGR